MRTWSAALLSLAVAIALALLPAPTTRAEPDVPPHVPGEVVVRLADGQTPDSVGIDASRVRDYSLEGGFVTVAVAEGTEAAAITAIEGQPGVAYAELNTLAQPAFVPDDTDYPKQWDMEMIGLEDAWDLTRGEGVTIAVLDTGVAFEDYQGFGRSPDLQNTFFIDPYDATTGTTHPNDTNGHGTHVTGTLAQDTDNGFGTAGVAPGAAIMPVKVCAAYGCSADDMAEGIYWAVDHGADVINMSLGGPSVTNVEREAYAYAEEHNVVVVAAAGNGGADFTGDNDLDYPAAVKTVVAVGSVDILESRAGYSNWGNGEGPAHTHVMAPGGDIRQDIDQDGSPDGVLQSTYAHSCGSAERDYKVFKGCFYHGTSMATPHVAGTAALALSYFPGMTAADVRQLLACTAKDLGFIGEDSTYGSGLVQADRALIDDDGDHKPDCIEPAVEFTAVIGDASVVPNGNTTIGLWAQITGDGVERYSVTIAYDREALRFKRCETRDGVTCWVSSGKVQFRAVSDGALTGSFRIGDIEFQAIGDVDTTATLDGNASAAQFYPSQLEPKITVDDGLITIREVPEARPGDSNCDGVIGTPDIVASLGTYAGMWDPFCAVYADTNCSNDVDLGDVLILITYLARIGPALPTGCPVPSATE